MNNWIFVAWGALLHPVWHLLVSTEEASMARAFPDEYSLYCSETGRFFSRL